MIRNFLPLLLMVVCLQKRWMQLLLPGTTVARNVITVDVDMRVLIHIIFTSIALSILNSLYVYQRLIHHSNQNAEPLPLYPE